MHVSLGWIDLDRSEYIVSGELLVDMDKTASLRDICKVEPACRVNGPVGEIWHGWNQLYSIWDAIILFAI